MTLYTKYNKRLKIPNNVIYTFHEEAPEVPELPKTERPNTILKDA